MEVRLCANIRDFVSILKRRRRPAFVAQPQPPIPLDAYHLCVFSQPNRRVEVTYTSLSLFYGTSKIIIEFGAWVSRHATPDVLAFLMVTFWARKARARGIHVTTILDVIAKDATYYFMVIFTSHLVLVMTLNLARVSGTVFFSYPTVLTHTAWSL